MDLTRRHRQDEVMDQPGLPAGEHRQALDALARINFLSGSAGILWPPIRKLAQRLKRPLRLLDVASGAGDVPVRLWQWAQQTGLSIDLEGWDISETAVAHARHNAERRGAKVAFRQRSVFEGDLPGDVDVMTCSLFLHHLDETEAITLMRRMGAAREMVLVNDLRRCRLGYLAALVGSRLLTRSRVVHVDAPLSVEGAFTLDEARQLAEAAGLRGARVQARWPWRFLLEWSR